MKWVLITMNVFTMNIWMNGIITLVGCPNECIHADLWEWWNDAFKLSYASRLKTVRYKYGQTYMGIPPSKYYKFELMLAKTPCFFNWIYEHIHWRICLFEYFGINNFATISCHSSFTHTLLAHKENRKQLRWHDILPFLFPCPKNLL